MSPGAAAMTDSVETTGTAAAATARARPLWWSLRRELWENRALYLVPLAVALLFLFGFLISLARLPQRMRAAMALDPMGRHAALVQPFDFAAIALMAVTFLVGLLYCLDALYGERRDRSILFWKSLPVSDRTAVLAKAGIATFLVPLISFVFTVAVQLVMLLLSSLVLAASGLSVATLWAEVPLLHMSLMLLYHLVTVHMFWYAPIYAWLLLVSAWAPRVPLVWAVLPPLAIAIVERLALGSTHFANLMARRMSGGAEAVLSTAKGMPIDPMTHITPVNYLISPELWIGLALAAAFLAAAVRLRRGRE